MDKKELPGSMRFTWAMIGDVDEGRANLGDKMPVAVYRLFQYTLRATLAEEYGPDECIRLFRKCGELAGREFCRNLLDVSLPLGEFVAQLQQRLKDMQIGILRFEQFDETTGRAVLTVGEDLDCSGLPVTGETVCNYDEGFIAGILGEYTKTQYVAIEVSCWAKGDRVCRFEAEKV
ncbi:MAG: 4-vinyl reductase [Oscillospiraceae bacterium]|nr:4-vinyl reductase [Oscillospiraceae bacterium]